MHHLAHELPFGLRLEEATTRERLPEDHRHGIEVGELGDLVTFELLGRHVRDLALELAGARLLETHGSLRHAEVEEPRHAVGADDDVLGGHVAMDDLERLTVGVRRLVDGVQCVQRGDDDPADDRNGHWDVLLAGSAHQLADGLALDVLHDETQVVVGADHIDGAHDVAVLHAARERELVEKHRDQLGARAVHVHLLDGERLLRA